MQWGEAAAAVGVLQASMGWRCSVLLAGAIASTMAFCAQQQRVRLEDSEAAGEAMAAAPVAAAAAAQAGVDMDAAGGEGEHGMAPEQEAAAAAVAATVRAAFAAVLANAAAEGEEAADRAARWPGKATGQAAAAAVSCGHSTADQSAAAPLPGMTPLSVVSSAQEGVQQQQQQQQEHTLAGPSPSAQASAHRSPSQPTHSAACTRPPAAAHSFLPLVLGMAELGGEVKCKLSLEGTRGQGLTLPCLVRTESDSAAQVLRIVLQVGGEDGGSSPVDDLRKKGGVGSNEDGLGKGKGGGKDEVGTSMGGRSSSSKEELKYGEVQGARGAGIGIGGGGDDAGDAGGSSMERGLEAASGASGSGLGGDSQSDSDEHGHVLGPGMHDPREHGPLDAAAFSRLHHSDSVRSSPPIQLPACTSLSYLHASGPPMAFLPQQQQQQQQQHCAALPSMGAAVRTLQGTWQPSCVDSGIPSPDAPPTPHACSVLRKPPPAAAAAHDPAAATMGPPAQVPPPCAPLCLDTAVAAPAVPAPAPALAAAVEALPAAAAVLPQSAWACMRPGPPAGSDSCSWWPQSTCAGSSHAGAADSLDDTSLGPQDLVADPQAAPPAAPAAQPPQQRSGAAAAAAAVEVEVEAEAEVRACWEQQQAWLLQQLCWSHAGSRQPSLASSGHTASHSPSPTPSLADPLSLPSPCAPFSHAIPGATPSSSSSILLPPPRVPSIELHFSTDPHLLGHAAAWAHEAGQPAHAGDLSLLPPGSPHHPLPDLRFSTGNTFSHVCRPEGEGLGLEAASPPPDLFLQFPWGVPVPTSPDLGTGGWNTTTAAEEEGLSLLDPTEPPFPLPLHGSPFDLLPPLSPSRPLPSPRMPLPPPSPARLPPSPRLLPPPSPQNLHSSPGCAVWPSPAASPPPGGPSSVCSPSPTLQYLPVLTAGPAASTHANATPLPPPPARTAAGLSGRAGPLLLQPGHQCLPSPAHCPGVTALCWLPLAPILLPVAFSPASPPPLPPRRPLSAPPFHCIPKDDGCEGGEAASSWSSGQHTNPSLPLPSTPVRSASTQPLPLASSRTTLPPPPSPRITAHAEQATAAQMGHAPPPSPCRHIISLPPSPLMRQLAARSAATRPTHAHTSPSNLLAPHQLQQERCSMASSRRAHLPSAPPLGLLPASDCEGGSTYLQDLPPFSPIQSLTPLPDSALSVLLGGPPATSPFSASSLFEEGLMHQAPEEQQQQQQQVTPLGPAFAHTSCLPPLPDDALASFLESPVRMPPSVQQPRSALLSRGPPLLPPPHSAACTPGEVVGEAPLAEAQVWMGGRMEHAGSIGMSGSSSSSTSSNNNGGGYGSMKTLKGAAGSSSSGEMPEGLEGTLGSSGSGGFGGNTRSKQHPQQAAASSSKGSTIAGVRKGSKDFGFGLRRSISNKGSSKERTPPKSPFAAVSQE